MARILVVEDEDNIGEVIELNLSMAGHNVVRCTTAEEAQGIWDSGDKDFDLALLDIMLPGMNGIFLSPEYGSRQRFHMIITDAEIEETPIFQGKVCDGCGKCAEVCPAKAIKIKGVPLLCS